MSLSDLVSSHAGLIKHVGKCFLLFCLYKYLCKLIPFFFFLPVTQSDPDDWLYDCTWANKSNFFNRYRANKFAILSYVHFGKLYCSGNVSTHVSCWIYYQKVVHNIYKIYIWTFFLIFILPFFFLDQSN